MAIRRLAREKREELQCHFPPKDTWIGQQDNNKFIELVENRAVSEENCLKPALAKPTIGFMFCVQNELGCAIQEQL